MIESPLRQFLPWDRPLLPQAAAWLARDWDPARGPLDLGQTLVIVPTRQSGRRLREALAELAAARGHAVFPPVVLLPEELAQPAAAGAPAASRLESQLAWAGVLREIDLDEFREVFPLDPPARNFSWAARLAKQFQQLQKTLAETGLRFGDVPRRGGADTPEAARWSQLAQLEARYDAALALRGWRDAQAARISAIRDGVAPRGVGRVVLLATPDPLPIAIELLGSLARRLPVEVVTFAPPRLAGWFDDWGRPRPEAWADHPLELENFEQCVRLCADPADQAARAVATATAYGQPAGRLALGLADPEVAPALEHGLREAGLAPFNPEGRPRRREAFFAMLSALAALVREPDFDAVAALARCPDFLNWLEARLADSNFTAANALLALDELHARHLPATLAAAQRAAADSNRKEIQAAGPVLAAVAQLRAVLTQDVFPANAAAALATLFGSRSMAGDDPVAEAAAAWMELLRSAGRAAAKFSGLTVAEWWDVTLDAFGEQSCTDDRPAGAVELLGWLELLWEDAPHLLVAGCNDGCVPDAVVGDAFLPESLRARLGLKTNAARFARDAYLLSALAASRTPSGRLDLLVGKVTLAGDPLRPSRLLLRCADSALPGRVAFLFAAVEAARPSPPWRRAWPLVPPVDAVINALSVTAFADYLHCPFRFYLRHGLGMESVDPEKTELDAMDFGTLVHAALEQLGLEPALRDCTDARALEDFLLAAFDRAARQRFGTELTLPLVIQFESARQRLARAAEVLAEQRAAGWVVERVEWKFPAAHALGGIAVRGKIDRIERHATTGRVRVVDFKTSDRPVSPREAHCRRLARTDDPSPPLARFSLGGEDLVWQDLQLPLYLDAVRAEFGADVECAYFNLPKAVGETAVVAWSDYSAEWHEAARGCAERIAAAVAARTFWPPAEVDERHEDERLEGLFHQGTAASVDWRGRR